MHITNIPSELIWAVVGLPLAAFAIIAPMIRPFKGKTEPASYISIAAVGLSFILSIWILISVFQAHAHRILLTGFDWLNISGGPLFNFGLLVDPLSAVMLVVVTSISVMVQIYSRSYMRSDPSYQRYRSRSADHSRAGLVPGSRGKIRPVPAACVAA